MSTSSSSSPSYTTDNGEWIPTDPTIGRPYIRQLPEREGRGRHPNPLQLPEEASEVNWFLIFALLGAAVATNEPFEPKTYQQARNDTYWPKWQDGMTTECDSLRKNKTWTLVERPADRKVLRGKWVYKLKRGPGGDIARWKARWVVRGFEQVEGLDYTETFASVVKPMSYKALFAIAAALDLEIEQMDVQTAFLYGQIDEEIYVEQPTGLEDGTNRVCKLNRALYGLKQSPRIWFQTLAQFLKTLGFEPLSADLGVFTNGLIFIAVYVDDLLIFGSSKGEIQKLKGALSKRFHMTDLGPCSYYLGMTIQRDRRKREIRLSQKGYIEKILRDFDMWDSNPVLTPMDTSKLVKAEEDYHCEEKLKQMYCQIVGSLMYIMMGTRADIAFAVSVLSRYMSNPNQSHLTAAKRQAC